MKGISAEAGAAHELAHAYVAQEYAIPFHVVTLGRSGDRVAGFVTLAEAKIETERDAIGLLSMYLAGDIAAQRWMRLADERPVFTGGSDHPEFENQRGIFAANWPEGWGPLPTMFEAYAIAQSDVHACWSRIIDKIPALVAAGKLTPGDL